MTVSPLANWKDREDLKSAEFGRSRNHGNRSAHHNFKQPAPLFFTQDGHPLWLGDIYRGRHAFLICGGPSFGALDHVQLGQPGVLTMGLNNSVRTFRPNLWCSVDSPDHWIRSLWLDPTIMKFVPNSHASKKIFNSDAWQHMDMKVGDCPNTVYFKRNECFKAKQFLWEDTFNWGNHTNLGGGRSVMLPSVRILFELGIRRVYLLGADFNMSPNATYHFDQNRHPGSVNGNSSTYTKMNAWFKELRPLFEAERFEIFNCNPESKLEAFDFMPFDEALSEIRELMDSVDPSTERTLNLYDTDTRDKEEGIGKTPTWIRLNTPKGVKKCRYCGKRCCKPSGDKTSPGKIQFIAGCEKSRQKLWQAKNGKYFGNLNQVGTDLLPEAEAIADWNTRFGRLDK